MSTVFPIDRLLLNTMGRVHELLRFLRGHNSMAIVCHDYPDPDCIASATALKHLAEWVGVPAVRILFGGSISHEQNRAMVRHLGHELVPLSSATLSGEELIAFVDHAVPGEHTQLSPAFGVDIVIDHHVRAHQGQVSADFVDLRPEYGATTTILVEYLSEVNYHPPATLASMLLFALHRERLDHIRRPTGHEYRAALFVYPRIDPSVIERLYNAQLSSATVDTIGTAIRNREVRGSRLVSWVGRVTEHDALPQAADYLVTLQYVDTVLVFGLLNGEIHLSARSEDPRVNLDSVVRQVVGPDGRAGGHEDMAGGVLPVQQYLGPQMDGAVLYREVVVPMTERFFNAVSGTPAVASNSSPPHTPHSDGIRSN